VGLNWDGIDSKHTQNLSGKCEKTRTLQRPGRRLGGGDVRTNLQATADKLDLSDSRECTVAVFREHENEIQLP
jgi:hypothetical protein